MSSPWDLATGDIVEVIPPPVPTVEVEPPVDPTVLVVPIAGPQGPQGPPGDASALEPYEHVQSSPQSVVTVSHGWGFKPSSVSLFSLDFTQEYSEFSVQHLDDNNLRISIDNPTAYVALIK